MPKNNDPLFVVAHAAVSGKGADGKPCDFYQGARVSAADIAAPHGPGLDLALEAGAVVPVSAAAEPAEDVA